LRKAKFGRVAEALAQGISFFKGFENYQTAYDVMGMMVRMRCKNACRGGGGNPYCKIRKCCQRKGFEGCWECDEIESCEKLESLVSVRGDAHVKNLRKIKKQGVEAFINGKRHW